MNQTKVPKKAALKVPEEAAKGAAKGVGPGEYGVTLFKPSKFQRESALKVPREAPEGVRLGGHGVSPVGGHGVSLEGAVNRPAERFSHLMLAVSDLSRSEAWYQEVVGLDLLGRDLMAEKRPHSVLKMNTGQLLMLVEVPKEELKNKGAGGTGVHHAFMTTPAAYRRVISRFVEMGFDMVDIRAQFRAHGEFSINFTDPDGHRLQIQCYGVESTENMPGAGVVDCGPADQYKVGAMKPFKTGTFYLVRKKDGFLAINRWCRHLNGIVVYQPKHWQFWCPFHGATYDRDGVNRPFPSNMSKQPLRLHPITFSDEGHILVDTDQVIERTSFDPSQLAVPPAAVTAALA